MDYHLICNEWSKPNNILFQLANVFIVFSNVNLNNRFTLLYIRFCLLFASLCYCLWGWIVLCSLDTFIWNFIFILINLYHISIILYNFYPFCPTMDSKTEQIYQKLELEGEVSRKTFYDIFFKNIWKTETLEKGEIYCVEDLSQANKLSLLLSGKIAVNRNQITLNEIKSLTFIDSAQWFVTTKIGEAQVSKVSLVALEKSQIICWNSGLIRRVLATEPALAANVNKILGEDAIKTFYLNSYGMASGLTNAIPF